MHHCHTGQQVDERVVSRLTGLLAGSFSFAQLVTSLLWGMISNQVGTKVCVLFVKQEHKLAVPKLYVALLIR